MQKEASELGLYDDEVEPIIDGKKRPEAKPLHLSGVFGNNIKFLKDNKNFNLRDKFEEIRDIEVTNSETRRTAGLFVEKNSDPIFKKGEKGYYAVLGTPMAKGKAFLLAQHVPEFEISEIGVSRGESGIDYIRYILSKKKALPN